jgi:hypothetical protein
MNQNGNEYSLQVLEGKLSEFMSFVVKMETTSQHEYLNK